MELLVRYRVCCRVLAWRVALLAASIKVRCNPYCRGPLVLEDTNVELMEGLGHNWECPHSFTLDGTTFVMMGMEPYPNPFGHAGVWLSGQLTNSTPARVDISHGKSGLADFGNLYAITSFMYAVCSTQWCGVPWQSSHVCVCVQRSRWEATCHGLDRRR